MNLQVKREEAARLASHGFYDVVSPGRIATRKVYHRFLGLVKPFLAVCLLILIILACFKTFMAKHPSLVAMEHRVSYGESLWTIADEYKPDGMSKGTYMDWVYSHNEGGMIYPGDVVIVGVADN